MVSIVAVIAKSMFTLDNAPIFKVESHISDTVVVHSFSCWHKKVSGIVFWTSLIKGKISFENFFSHLQIQDGLTRDWLHDSTVSHLESSLFSLVES